MFRRNPYKKSLSSPGKWRRRLRLAVRAVALLFVFDLGYVAGLWPDWDLYAVGPILKSSFIKRYEHERIGKGGPALRWKPVALEAISPHVVSFVVVAEDSRFYDHGGFDKAAFDAAMEVNLSRRRFIYGASTISQQTVKNLLLGPSRNPVRKWHELLLTLGMELELDKERILEIYLNVAELGPGIYGVEAAARAYWGISASQLSRTQAAELAATLPAPRKHNPKTRTSYFRSRSQRLLRQLSEV